MLTPGFLQRSQVLAAAQALVAAWTTTGIVHLFTAVSGISDLVAPSNFTEPVGTWYHGSGGSAKLQTWGNPYYDDGGSVSITGVSTQIDYAGSSPSETILGYFITDTTGATVLDCGYLPEPIVMGQVGDSVVVQPTVNFKGSQPV